MKIMKTKQTGQKIYFQKKIYLNKGCLKNEETEVTRNIISKN